MSLPPQVLKIKRKRAEEPVDSLYLESHDDHLPSKRRVTHHGFVFRRQVRAAVASPEAQTDVYTAPGIPVIRSTVPGEEDSSAMGSGAMQQSQTSTVKASAHGGHVDQEKPSRLGSSEARFFRLTQPSESGNGRAGTVHDENLAVFVEDKRPRPEALTKVSNKDAVNDSTETTPRKRPSARVGGPRTRIARADKPGVDPKLLIAMQNMAAEHLSSGDSIESHAVTANRNESEDVAMGGAIDEAEYVYDTYVRHENHDSVIGSTVMDTMSTSSGGIGYLVIEEKDQPLWETYADYEDESEQDWDSEQDDENAENYYGADYPEDEVALDDEYDVDSYQYRTKGASEDEEFGSDEDPWGEEEASRHPWKYASWMDRHAHATSDDDEDDDENEEVK